MHIFGEFTFNITCLTRDRSYFGNMNTFGGPSEVSLKTSARMLKTEEANEEAMIVFIADIWLDNNKVSGTARALLV